MDQAIKELRLQVTNKQGDNQIKQERLSLDKYLGELKESNDTMQLELQARYDKELEALKQSFKQIQNITLPMWMTKENSMYGAKPKKKKAPPKRKTKKY